VFFGLGLVLLERSFCQDCRTHSALRDMLFTLGPYAPPQCDGDHDPGLLPWTPLNWPDRPGMVRLLRSLSIRGHRPKIMFGVLVVVLCRDCIAILCFHPGQRQIPLIALFQVLKALRLKTGCDRHPALGLDSSWCHRPELPCSRRWPYAISHFSPFDGSAGHLCGAIRLKAECVSEIIKQSVAVARRC
jgi:hypothetical protein